MKQEIVLTADDMAAACIEWLEGRGFTLDHSTARVASLCPLVDPVGPARQVGQRLRAPAVEFRVEGHKTVSACPVLPACGQAQDASEGGKPNE